ncbi:hypothetical protein DPX16_1058, partial [Anabarilius grahami]
GSRLEATEGQNVTISFDIDEVEKATQVKITFKGVNEKQPSVIAQRPWISHDEPPAGVSLRVEKGRVNVTIQHVNISSSGLYEALALFKNKKPSRANATLLVNEAPFSSTSAPPHSSTPKPPDTSNVLWLCAVIPLVIVISVVICFCKRRKATLIVAGSRLEATEGQNATISFDIDEVEKATQVKITSIRGNEKQPSVIAQRPWISHDEPPAGVSLLVEKGRVSLTIQHVSISDSGLYKAQALIKFKKSTASAVLLVHIFLQSSTTSDLQSSATAHLHPKTSQLI